MIGLAVHGLHYGLFVAGLVTIGLLVRSVRQGRREARRPGDEHARRVAALRAAARDGGLVGTDARSEPDDAAPPDAPGAAGPGAPGPA